jgi:hypothetical protein
MIKSGRYVAQGALSFELDALSKMLTFRGALLPWQVPREPHASAAFSVTSPASPNPALGLATFVLQEDGETLLEGGRPWRWQAPGLFTCVEAGCGYATKRAWNLKQHVRARHTSNRPFPCDAAGCARTFASSAALKLHWSKHPENAPSAPAHACAEPNCVYRAHSVAALVRHTRKEGHAGSVACPDCDLRCASSRALRAHLVSAAHAGGGGKPQCKTCGETLGGRAEYKAHMRAHRLKNLAGAGKKK